MNITMKVEGLRELGEVLQRLEKDVQINILRQSGKSAMVPVLEDMKTHAGFDETVASEHMRDSIKIRSSRSKKTKGAVLITVGPTQKHYMKARAQEFGTIKQIAHPFIRPALDYNKQAVLKILVSEIRDALRQFK
ncbi:TPA: HK97 gp10 family phage protein [Proteus mirabilis]|nr:HK97 gp10 family phage protein [Proteus mirabilis]